MNKKTQIALVAAAAGAATIVGTVGTVRNAPKQPAFYTCASDTTGNCRINAPKGSLVIVSVRGRSVPVGTPPDTQIEYGNNGQVAYNRDVPVGAPPNTQIGYGDKKQAGADFSVGLDNGETIISQPDDGTNQVDLAWRPDEVTARIYDGSGGSNRIACRQDPAFSKGCGTNIVQPK